MVKSQASVRKKMLVTEAKEKNDTGVSWDVPVHSASSKKEPAGDLTYVLATVKAPLVT